MNLFLGTEHAKEHVNPTLEQDDGTFWMSFEDVLKFFQRMTVCYCEPGTSGTALFFWYLFHEKRKFHCKLWFGEWSC